jgi:hypothetical protein
MSEPIRNLSDAVAALGALPMPVGPEPESSSPAEANYIAPSPSCTRCYGADATRFVAQGGATAPCPVCGPSEVERLRAQVEALLVERHSTNEALDDAVQALRLREAGPALPWAHAMSDHDLHGFLDDLVSAAMGRWRSEPEVPDRTVLADIEKVCAAWRTPGVGSRLDGSEFDGATVRLAEPEPEFHAWLHHENRVGHDLPETGGAR